MALLNDSQANTIVGALVEIGSFLPLATKLAAVLGQPEVAIVTEAATLLIALQELVGKLRGQESIEAAAAAARGVTLAAWRESVQGAPLADTPE